MAEVFKSHYLDTPLEEQVWASLMFVAHKTALDGFRISGLKGKWKKVRWLDYSGKKLDEAALEALLLILFSAILLECRCLRYALERRVIKLPEKQKKGKKKPIPPGLQGVGHFRRPF